MRNVVIQSTLKTIARDFMQFDDRKEMLIDTAFAVDDELKTKGARNSDKYSDDFVRWDFKRTWRRGGIKEKDTFGTDYDYFTKIAKEAHQYFRTWAPSADPDIQGHNWYGSAPMSFRESLRIWQNTKPVEWGQPLTGPQIDIGPVVDYGLFLEEWVAIKGMEAYTIILQGIGLMHAIAARLNMDWRGAHHIYPMAIKPDHVLAAERRLRKSSKSAGGHALGKSIDLYPIIRIQSRHR